MRRIAVLLFCAGGLCGQIVSVPDTTFPSFRALMNANFSWIASNMAGLGVSNTMTGYTNFSGGRYRLPESTFASPPSSPLVGQAWLFTDASAAGTCTGGGSSLAQCRWSGIAWQAIGGGGGGGLSVKTGGVVVGTRSIANFIAGVGIVNTVSDDGTEINIQSALDTAVVQTQLGEQSGSALLCASSSGSATQYACSMDPTLAAYTSGMALHWKPDVAGAGGATTLNVDALGTRSLKESDGATDPASTDISAGKLYSLWYDGSVFRFLAAVGGTGSGPSASNSTPAMDGTGAAGSSANYARGDHVHPTDSSRAPVAIYPNTAPSPGQLPVGNAGGTGYAPVTLSGSCTITSAGVVTCTGGGTSQRTINNQGLVQAGVSGMAVNLPSSNAPTPTSAGGTDPMAVLEFPQGLMDYAWWSFLLPSGYTTGANVSILVESRCNPAACDSTHATTVTPYYTILTGALDAPTWTAGSPFTITNNAAGAVKQTTATITPTGATSGQRLGIKLVANTGALASGDSFQLVSFDPTVQASSGAVASTGGANHVQTADGAGGFVDSGCTATGGAETCASGFAGNATTASNLSGTPAIPNGTTATTQTTGDSSTKIATDAFVAAALPAVVADSSVLVGTAAIAANTCTSTSTVSMLGVTTATAFFFTPTADVSAITGWGPGGAQLFFDAWPSANTLNYKVCNNSGASITPGSSTTWNVGAR